MKFTILTLFITISFNCFSQAIITDSAFYDNGKIRSYGTYDSTHKYWKLFNFYESGQIESIRKLSPVYFWDIDTFIVYHRNGNVAWILPHTDSNFITGKITGYYKDGTIKLEAYYYRGFRTGTWKEYYQNGKTKSISYYAITPKDSAHIYRLPAHDDDKDSSFKREDRPYFEQEFYTWGKPEPDDTATYNGVLYSDQTSLILTSYISQKTGNWKTYDPFGKKRSKQLTAFDTTYIVKKLIGKYEVPFDTIKEIYQKCKTFEELIQMLHDKVNIFDYELKSYLKYDIETLREIFDEPKLALGLKRLIFNEHPKETEQKQ